MNLAAILQWLAIAQQIEAKGADAWAQIKQSLTDNGIDADTSELDAVIADAARRKALADSEAVIVPPTSPAA